MIVVEGPDGAGKTTLAKYMAEALDLPYTRPPKELLTSTGGPTEGLVDWWEEQLLDKTPRVFDRTAYISDAIYCAVGDRMPLMGWESMERGMNLIQTSWITIFCIPDFDVIGSNIEKDMAEGQHLKGLETDERIYNHYFLYRMWHYLWRQHAPHRTNWYDYTLHARDDMVEWVDNVLRNPAHYLSS